MLRFDQAVLRQYAAQLVPRTVIRLHSDLAGKPKWHIIVSCDASRTVAFLINTGVAPFIMRQPDRVRRHIDILQAEHPFLDHDSKIACDDLVAIDGARDLASKLAMRKAAILGRVTDDCARRILAASIGSSLIADRDHAQIGVAFGPPV